MYNSVNASNSRTNHLVGERIFGAENDIWAFGLTVMECINLEYPLDDNASLVSMELFDSIINKPILVKEEVSKFYSAELKHFVSKCLERGSNGSGKLNRWSYKELQKDPFWIKCKDAYDVSNNAGVRKKSRLFLRQFSDNEPIRKQATKDLTKKRVRKRYIRKSNIDPDLALTIKVSLKENEIVMQKDDKVLNQALQLPIVESMTPCASSSSKSSFIKPKAIVELASQKIVESDKEKIDRLGGENKRLADLVSSQSSTGPFTNLRSKKRKKEELNV